MKLYGEPSTSPHCIRTSVSDSLGYSKQISIVHDDELQRRLDTENSSITCISLLPRSVSTPGAKEDIKDNFPFPPFFQAFVSLIFKLQSTGARYRNAQSSVFTETTTPNDDDDILNILTCLLSLDTFYHLHLISPVTYLDRHDRDVSIMAFDLHCFPHRRHLFVRSSRELSSLNITNIHSSLMTTSSQYNGTLL